MVKILAGNKCECSTSQRAVEKERGEKVCDNYLFRFWTIDTAILQLVLMDSFLQIAENFDMPFFEVSCKQNINIEECFLSLARSIREQRDNRVTFEIFLRFQGYKNVILGRQLKWRRSTDKNEKKHFEWPRIFHVREHIWKWTMLVLIYLDRS